MLCRTIMALSLAAGIAFACGAGEQCESKDNSQKKESCDKGKCRSPEERFNEMTKCLEDKAAKLEAEGKTDAAAACKKLIEAHKKMKEALESKEQVLKDAKEELKAAKAEFEKFNPKKSECKGDKGECKVDPSKHLENLASKLESEGKTDAAASCKKLIEAHKKMKEALESKDKDAIEAAKKDIKAAHEEFKKYAPKGGSGEGRKPRVKMDKGDECTTNSGGAPW